jgi:peptide/nickel transport system substrate-binding protein
MMKTVRWLALLVALVLLVAACDDSGSAGAGDGKPSRGVKRGTLRVFNYTDVEALDPGIAYRGVDFALLRGLVRELYSFDSRLQGERSMQPVPDLADGPYELSADGRSYTFKLRKGVLYDLPDQREVRAEDFIYAIERQLDPPPTTPPPHTPR